MLEEGWVIANHKLVSFHAAFLSSLLSIPFLVGHRTDVLNFMFNPMEKEAGCYFQDVKAQNLAVSAAGPSISGKLCLVTLPSGQKVRAPWQHRNCLMGGRHTEEQGGNLSFQEFMFVPLSATDYVEAQRMTNALQSRVIQIVQDSEGMNFVGIGLEGGMVGGYSRRSEDATPEERAIKVAVQAIEECGFVPGKDVALALDPAASELSNAYREHTGKSDAVGQYFFWRAEEPRTMSSEELVDMYKDGVAKYPIVSIEDGFAEDDYEGWKMLMKEMGDRIFIIGDDLVVTKDTTIAHCIEQGLINTALIKANQIGSLSETLKFKKGLTNDAIAAKNDKDLSELWRRAQRYAGKGCLNAADNVEKFIAPLFVGKTLAEVGNLVDVDHVAYVG